MARPSLNLEMVVPADWARVDPTSRAVGLLVKVTFGNAELCDSLAMVSAELLENAVKYSRPDSTMVLRIAEEEDRVVVAVTNVGEAQHLDALRARLDWMRSFDSPADAYRAALERIYAGGRSDDGGLGMVRIAYEGGCGLDCQASDAGEVTVRAYCSLTASS